MSWNCLDVTISAAVTKMITKSRRCSWLIKKHLKEKLIILKDHKSISFKISYIFSPLTRLLPVKWQNQMGLKRRVS